MWEHRGAVLALVLVVMFGKFLAVSIGGFLAGTGTRTAVKAGLSMTQIGEFSFILAALGVASGTIRPFLYPVVVAVSAITALTTPWLIRWSDGIASEVDRKLPKPLQTYASLYGSWLDELRSGARVVTTGRLIRRKLRGLMIDTAMLAVLAIAAVTLEPRVATWALGTFGLERRLTGWIVALGAVAIGSVFIWGIVRIARTLAEQLAGVALPQEGKLDRAAVPRRTLVVTIEILILLLTGLPLLAVTQPFLPPFRGALVLAVVLALLSVAAWRSAQNLQGHIRAGAEVLMAAVQSALPPEHATAEMPAVALRRRGRRRCEGDSACCLVSARPRHSGCSRMTMAWVARSPSWICGAGPVRPCWALCAVKRGLRRPARRSGSLWTIRWCWWGRPRQLRRLNRCSSAIVVPLVDGPGTT